MKISLNIELMELNSHSTLAWEVVNLIPGQNQQIENYYLKL